ncbi:MAG: penicillin-binding protein, partial [Mycobacterium sp.]|nr:penicillin-binding protein [Mycobacterium sp.]
MSDEGRHSRPGNDMTRGPAAGGSSGRPGQVPPDDRRTMILPPVGKVDDPRLRDPIDAVKAALDGTKRPSQPPMSAGAGMNPPPKPPPPPPPRAGGQKPGRPQ